MARSKLARVMPLACASGQSSVTNAANDWSCACAGTPTKASRIVSAARQRIDIVLVPLIDSYRTLYQRYQCAAVALEPAGDFEFQQHGAHNRGRGARHPYQ